MIEAILVAKFVSLTVGIAYGFTCAGRAANGQAVSQTQTFLMASGISAFVVLASL